MGKMYIVPFESFNPTLFRDAETIICKEMSEGWLDRDYPKQIWPGDGKQIVLKKGESVAIACGREGSVDIFTVFTVE